MSFADFLAIFCRSLPPKSWSQKFWQKNSLPFSIKKGVLTSHRIDIERCNVWILQNFFLQTFMKRQKKWFSNSEKLG